MGTSGQKTTLARAEMNGFCTALNWSTLAPVKNSTVLIPFSIAGAGASAGADADA